MPKPTHYIPPRDNWRQAQARRQRDAPPASDDFASDLTESHVWVDRMQGQTETTPQTMERFQRTNPMMSYLMRNRARAAAGPPQVSRTGFPTGSVGGGSDSDVENAPVAFITADRARVLPKPSIKRAVQPRLATTLKTLRARGAFTEARP